MTFTGVDCVSTTWCMAIGWGIERILGRPAAFSYIWNGSSWTSAGLPAVANAISCLSTTSCTAVGDNLVLMSWNGTTWATMGYEEFPIREVKLNGISCKSPTATDECMAVGSFKDSSGLVRTLVLHRSGRRWSQMTSGNPIEATRSELKAVSCKDFSECVGVGDYTTSSGTFSVVLHWFGTTWSVERSPNPPGATSTRLHGVFCKFHSACTAVGQFRPGGASGAVIERYDGTSWTVEPAIDNPGIGEGNLLAVSCTEALPCVAVGSYGDAFGKRVTAAYHRFAP